MIIIKKVDYLATGHFGRNGIPVAAMHDAIANYA